MKKFGHTGYYKSAESFNRVSLIGRKNRKHGLTGKRLSNILHSMKQRCFYKKGINYSSYGGRGITICDEWLKDSRIFFEWALNNGYDDSLSIERIDVNGNYCPENCKWVSLKSQARNKRNTLKVSAFGEIKALNDWAEDARCVVSVECLYKRIVKYDYNPELAITSKKYALR